MSGITVTQFRERDELIDVVLRGSPAERVQLSFLRDLAIPSRNGKAVPITQIADIRYGLEEGIVWRRGRQPTVTVRADVRGDAQGPDVTKRISPNLDPLRATLPLGYRIELGGAIEDSARGQKSIAAGVPLLVLTVLTLLMIQLKSFSRTAMVLLTAPLGLIGVTLGLLAFRMPFGFVSMLGTIALSGIIMRNSVILVDQIERDIAAGESAWDAIVGATVRRFRPDRAHGCGGDPRDDPADAQRFLRADGGRDDGRHLRRDAADAGLPARAVRAVVPCAQGTDVGARCGSGVVRGRRPRAGGDPVSFRAYARAIRPVQSHLRF